MQQLLNIMLRDQNERPSAELLLQHPALVFFDYMVNRVDQNFSFDYAMNDQITKKIEIIPSLVSALSLSNKNKAIVAFFTLMRMLEQHQYEQRFQRHVIDLVLSNQAHIQITELLVICLKEYSIESNSFLAPPDQDSFVCLYQEAYKILLKVLEESVDQKRLKTQLVLSGFVSLVILLNEKLKFIAL